MDVTFFCTKQDNYRQLTLLAILIVLLVIIGGCAGSGNYGRLQRSHEAHKIFNSYQVLPDYKYYYSGPEGRPDAIMGVLNEYALQTTHWTQIDATEVQLKKLIDWINFHHGTNVRYYPYGFVILDPKGNCLGVWYSIWDWTTVMVEDDKRIWVFPPATRDPFGNGDDRERMKMD